MIKITRQFNPEWISPPGDTIADILEERNWTQTELAKHLGYSSQYISLLINGKVAINEEIALKLEQVLGGKAEFWLRREAQYNASLIKKDNKN